MQVKGIHAPERGPGTDWRARGACLEVDPELFFPVGEKGLAVVQAEQARAVCLGCPVVETCRAWALDHEITYGVWGATTEWERREIFAGRRRQARAAVQASAAAAAQVAARDVALSPSAAMVSGGGGRR